MFLCQGRLRLVVNLLIVVTMHLTHVQRKLHQSIKSIINKVSDVFYMTKREWEKMTQPLLRVNRLKKYFPIRKNIFGKPLHYVRAVNNVSFEVYPGETLGIVGESGCGKSTTGRLIMQLIEATEGMIQFNGEELTALSKRELRSLRKDMQMVFQDSYASLNPRHTIEKILGEPLLVH